MTALMLVAAILQTPPPSPVTFDAPAALFSRSVFECQGRTVELELRAESRAGVQPRGMQITKYRSGSRMLDAGNLARWNEQLAPIKLFISSEFWCQSGGRELVTVHGNDAEGRRVSLSFRMEDGELIILNRR